MVRPLRGASLAALAFVAAACAAAGGAQAPSGTAAPSADTTAELPALKVSASIPGFNYPAAIADTGDAVWVLGHTGAEWYRIDPASNTVTDTVGVGGPYAAGGILVDGRLWALDFTDQTVTSVDPTTRKAVSTIPVGVDGGWLVGDKGAVYVVGNDATEAKRIDAKTGKVTSLALDPACGNSPAAGGDYLWMISAGGTLCKLDPATGKVLAKVDGLATVQWIGYAGGRVFVPTPDGGVSIVDPAAMTVVATVPAPAAGTYQGNRFTLGTPGDGVGLASDGETAWIRFTGATVGRLDLAGGSPTWTVYAGLPLGHDATGLAVAHGSLWFGDVDGSTVVRTAIP